jgi:thimet oligopeptidase
MNRAALAATFLLAACSHDPGRNGSGGGEGGIVDAAPLRTDWTPERLKAACEEAQKTCDAKLAKIAGLRDAERTFANTPEAIEQVTTDWSEVVGRASFMKDIHRDEKVRAAAAACEEEAGKYGARIASRKDLYLAVKSWQARGEQVGPQDRRLVDLMMRDFRRAGVELVDEQREKLVSLRSRLAELQTRFSSNLDEDTTSVEMTAEELDGMPRATSPA